MGRCNKVCAHMDGTCRYACSDIYGNLDLQMGYQQDACIEGITIMGKEFKLKKLIKWTVSPITTFSIQRVLNI